MKSMRAELWGEYQEIVREYKNAGWGIYDDSADLDRAIEVCDGYYGDGSSIEYLCQQAERPILLQNPNLRNINSKNEKKNKSGSVWPSCYVEDKRLNIIFFSNMLCNELYEFDVLNQKLKLLVKYPLDIYSMNGDCMYMYENILYDGKYLILIPKSARLIAIYDLDKRELRSIDLNTYIRDDRFSNNNFVCTLYQGYIFFLCIDYPLLFKFNILTRIMEKVFIPSKYNNIFDGNLSKRGIHQSNKWAIMNKKKPIIVIIDLNTGMLKTKKYIHENVGFNTGLYEKSSYWLVGSNYKYVYKLYDGDLLEKFTLNMDEKDKNKFNDILIYNGEIIFSPTYGENIYVFDLNKCICKKMVIFTKYKEWEHRLIFMNDKYMYFIFFPIESSPLIETEKFFVQLDVKNWNIKKFDYMFPATDNIDNLYNCIEYNIKQLLKTGFSLEMSSIYLNFFLEHCIKKIYDEKYNEYGKSIYLDISK